MSTPLLTLRVCSQRDVVLARQRARQVAGLLSFARPRQTAFAATVFEIALRLAQRPGGGSLRFELSDDALHVVPKVAAEVRRETRRWVNRLRVRDGREGDTPSRLVEPLPDQSSSPPREDLPWLIAELTRHTPLALFEEMCLQNRELLWALDEIEARRAG